MIPSLLITACLTVCVLAVPAAELRARQAGCKKVHFIFARGSTEAGTMGQTVGPAFSRALQSKFGAGNVASEGVPYPADIAGAFSGGTNPSGAQGSIKMAAMAKTVIGRCPESKIVLSGYSQGAEQVHGALAAKNLGADGAKIAAAVTFGDPLKNFETFVGGWGSLPKARTLVFCNQGDGVCGGAFSISAAHLSYTSNGDITKGVNFVATVINNPGGLPGANEAPAAPPSGGVPKGAGSPKGAGMPKGGAGPKGSGAPKGSGLPKDSGTPKGTGMPEGTGAPEGGAGGSESAGEP